MTLDEITTAVDDGQIVCWSNTNYEVIHDLTNGCDQWLIMCLSNRHCIGLTWMDNVTMNGKEEDFFIRTTPRGPLE